MYANDAATDLSRAANKSKWRKDCSFVSQPSFLPDFSFSRKAHALLINKDWARQNVKGGGKCFAFLFIPQKFAPNSSQHFVSAPSLQRSTSVCSLARIG